MPRQTIHAPTISELTHSTVYICIHIRLVLPNEMKYEKESTIIFMVYDILCLENSMGLPADKGSGEGERIRGADKGGGEGKRRRRAEKGD